MNKIPVYEILYCVYKWHDYKLDLSMKWPSYEMFCVLGLPVNNLTMKWPV